MNFDFDYLVIGGGSGGIASANRAAIYGAKTAIIEQDAIGGTCVNRGCVPKKVLWNGATILEQLKNFAQGYGFEAAVTNVDYATLKTNTDAYISRIHNAYQNGFTKNNVTILRGKAHLFDKHTVMITHSDGTQQAVTGKRILLAPGAYPETPKNIPGADLGITSDDFFNLELLPNHITIVGAGYIAVELAGVLATFGSKVTLVTRHDRPLRWLDSDISDHLMQAMARQGINHICNTQVTSISKTTAAQSIDNLSITLDNGDTLNSDCLIWAIGRLPNTQELQLDTVGIATDAKGFILTNQLNETNVANIYAIGDATHMPALTPAAVAAGRRLSERLFNNKVNLHFDHKLIPTVIFSHPAIGTVGMSEQAAVQEFGMWSDTNPNGIKVYKSTFTAMISAVTEHREPSFMKLVVQGNDEKIIGLHGIGHGVDEMIQGFAVAMSMGATKADFDNTLAIHPTGAEEFVTMR